MKITKTKVAVVLAALLAPATAAAQVAPKAQPSPAPPNGQLRRTAPPSAVAKAFRRPDLGAWWKNSDVVQELALSREQVSQIEQAFFEHRLKLIDLKAAVEREETRLQPLMEADQVREAEIAAQIEKVVSARGALEVANVMMMVSIRKVLTVDQWKQLETMQRQRRTKFEQFRWYIEGGGKKPAHFKWQKARPPDEFEFVPYQP